MAVDGDLIAQEARNHHKSSCLFHKPNVSIDLNSIVDTTLLHTFEVLEQNRTKVGKTVEIMDVYREKGGTSLSRRTLQENFQSQFAILVMTF